MRDPNPPKKVNICYFCTPGVTHIINPIDYPNDIQASPDNLGRWIRLQVHSSTQPGRNISGIDGPLAHYQFSEK